METQCAALADALHGARQRAIAHLDGARDLMHIEGPLDRT